MRRSLARALPVLFLLGCRTAPPAASLPQGTPPPPPEAASQPQAAPEEPAQPYSNTLRWSTASEVDNFGYDVYRATHEEGPFERITTDPVAGAGTTDVPQRYSYVDTAIDPHVTYYYYVESISLGGVRERFTPVITAKAKLPPDASSAP